MVGDLEAGGGGRCRSVFCPVSPAPPKFFFDYVLGAHEGVG